MRETYFKTPIRRKHTIELTHDERVQLDAIIDLLIPSDENFPPPSSLHLLDEFLFHLSPHAETHAPPMLNVKRLRMVLRDLNALAGGNFCNAHPETQQMLLRHLEQHDPAFFQELWTIANHSYYTRLAVGQSAASPTPAQLS